MGLKPRPDGEKYTIEDGVHFLNVDLELESPVDLTPLVQAFGPIYLLHKTSEHPFVANLEIENACLDCEDTIAALLDLVENLDKRARGLWEDCRARRFDIGLQSGLTPHYKQYRLSATLMKRLTAIGAEVVTLYGAQYETPT